jgi:hypothetical protein
MLKLEEIYLGASRMYHSNENERVIEAKASRDKESRVCPNSYNCHNDRVKNAVDVYDAGPACLWMSIVRLRPTFYCL